jgi:hypothetical protein
MAVFKISRQIMGVSLDQIHVLFLLIGWGHLFDCSGRNPMLV